MNEFPARSVQKLSPVLITTFPCIALEENTMTKLYLTPGLTTCNVDTSTLAGPSIITYKTNQAFTKERSDFLTKDRSKEVDVVLLQTSSVEISCTTKLGHIGCSKFWKKKRSFLDEYYV